MNIYTDDVGVVIFSAPYNGKRLLDDSMERTLTGYGKIKSGTIAKGLGDVLLARVESAVAFSFVALSTLFLVVCDCALTPCFLLFAIPLNLMSRIPGISSFESVQHFTRESSDAISRTLKIHCVAIPVIFLFLSASGINTFLPGVLKPQNVFSRTIHNCVESLGPLHTIRAVVPNVGEAIGSESRMSILTGVEEYFRALSSQNYLATREVDEITRYHYYTD